MTGITDILRQAQELQQRLDQLQEETAAKIVEASAGGGMVSAKMNGRLQLVELRIDPSLVSSGDLEMLQDVVRSAVNEVLRAAQAMVSEEMTKVTRGLGFPRLDS